MTIEDTPNELHVVCTYCDADVGVPCKGDTGTHRLRTEAAERLSKTMADLAKSKLAVCQSDVRAMPFTPAERASQSVWAKLGELEGRIKALEGPVVTVPGRIADEVGGTADPEDMELLAAAEHESWSVWTAYMLDTIEKESGGDFNIKSLPCVERWMRQKVTPYASLSEKEKESDREVVRKKLPLYRP